MNNYHLDYFLLEKTIKGKRQKTACGCPFLQHDRVECLSNDILV